MINGFDFPMVYSDLYIPQIAEGLNIRFGRYISIPDIEAQLAPNNFTYTHSLTYTLDNYTNTGILFSLAATKNWLVQVGIDDGTETPLWNNGRTIENPFPNPLYPNSTFLKDPGNQPTLSFCLRWTSDSGNDSIYPCLDGMNNAAWGYNNLQWHGIYLVPQIQRILAPCLRGLLDFRKWNSQSQESQRPGDRCQRRHALLSAVC